MGQDSVMSRPRGPSGEACTELLLVTSWPICGDMMGDCGRLEVMEEQLTAEVGTDMEEEEVMVGRKEVCSFAAGLTRR